ncbi:hypothetical protein CEUSTIGMA_g5225.t1 [Chlamydomonas eustigma]|uniref:Uncharacterized protein n=1 Tax=Chlamydomonas eustigma TaxID=1157962 RepID=A0A250X4G2_9CHLO|nr:hypothetical protein CEUSTIGMA_g5225.t1 [Chlamydomonas eustigma]|eukprot:GAX77782.1 hypothetical protein CEUSTIGMA_g5225.t1 [Chlamydomonas eustigma]
MSSGRIASFASSLLRNAEGASFSRLPKLEVAHISIGCFSSLMDGSSWTFYPSTSVLSDSASTSSQQFRRLHEIPYSLRSGTPRPGPWPEFEKIKRGPSGDIKWHRSLYRFPPEVEIKLEDRMLSLSGNAGTIRLNLTVLDPSGLVAFKMLQLPGRASNSKGIAASNNMLALVSPDKERFKEFTSTLDSSIRGITVGYLVGITVKGVGYRIEPMEEAPAKRTWYFIDDEADRSAIVYPHPKPVPAVRLKVGYSRTAVFPFPDGIRAFCIKPTLLYLYGIRKEEVDAAAGALRAIRKPNAYTGNGVQLLEEVVKIKQRKASK